MMCVKKTWSKKLGQLHEILKALYYGLSGFLLFKMSVLTTDLTTIAIVLYAWFPDYRVLEGTFGFIAFSYSGNSIVTNDCLPDDVYCGTLMYSDSGYEGIVLFPENPLYFNGNNYHDPILC